jgi:membrane protein implicated in regulation of membrane protease activity
MLRCAPLTASTPIAPACRYRYIPPSVPAAAIKTLLIILGYVFLLIAALVIVNIVLTRRTREERDAERMRRRQRKPS